MRTELTSWDVWTYDVWGNKDDGFEVNDRYRSGSVDVRSKVETYNVGTAQQFDSASPSNYQIGRIFGTRCAIDTDGDDLVIYVTRTRDGFPIGELHCTSHASLSPIRKGGN